MKISGSSDAAPPDSHPQAGSAAGAYAIDSLETHSYFAPKMSARRSPPGLRRKQFENHTTVNASVHLVDMLEAQIL